MKKENKTKQGTQIPWRKKCPEQYAKSLKRTREKIAKAGGAGAIQLKRTIAHFDELNLGRYAEDLRAIKEKMQRKHGKNKT